MGWRAQRRTLAYSRAGTDEVTPDLARVLKHELTHSFVGQKTHGRAPTWLQEGIAQWMEGTPQQLSGREP